ncbi:MAG: tetratricopeptide repeat protein, partial [Methylotenera sp.]
MQKLDRNNENNKNYALSSVATPVCPQCGNEKVRRSSTKTSDWLLRILFCKSYRCQICRFRFWVLNPIRLVLCAGISVLFIPVLGAAWMAFNEQPKVVSPVETVSQDQIKQLAENGDAEAELKMGLRYTSIARGVKNDRIAAQWFERAAQHSQVKAQYRYGLALLNGQGIVQDYKMAFYWMEKAAQQGHAQAQSTLGEMYHSGIAINSDIERAYLWFNLAAAQGVVSAASSRDIVVKLLTPNQIIALQQEAGRISRGYSSLSVADESDSVVVDSAFPYEPMPVVT